MEFIKDNYKVIVLEDYEEINIYLYEVGDEDPMLFLNLKPLHPIDTSLDDKTVIRDIPRELFNEGDFYQSVVNRYNHSEKYQGISFLAIIHDIILENNVLVKIKNIFSSSLKNYKEEIYMTDKAKEFWILQLNKKPDLPINYYKEDQRFVLKINENV